ncbi:MAG TPA: hypothetical protein VK625_05050 [Flavitalea sp.]|nr:hypothetical protein [Flavitalea sp.]
MKKHCILILVSYEYESLQLTFKGLDHTADPSVPIIIVLNGASFSYKGSKVEQHCRAWASLAENRYVIRPMACGKAPIYAIQEVLRLSPILKDIDYVLKIDDDVIPLKKGWDVDLANCYFEYEKLHGKIGFVTGLINNNCWGFKELLSIYEKWDEYARFMNHPSTAGVFKDRIVKIGEVDTGQNGTIHAFPTLAAWLHKWTSFDIDSFVEKTRNGKIKEVELDVHYSIGCMYSHKSLWTDLEVTKATDFDELIIHRYCLANKLRKFAVMSQPMLHLYYNNQRLINAYLLPQFIKHLSAYFKDESIKDLEFATVQDQAYELEDQLKMLKDLDRRFGFLETNINRVKKVFKPFS